MQLILFALSLATLVCACTATLAADDSWKLASAPLLTRWAKAVSPTNARKEYPRPQAVRKEWKSLNGLWEFAFDDANQGRAANWATGKSFPQHILVPYTFESALSGIGKGKEIHERVWYRRTFTVPGGWKGKHVLLHFGAVDWETTVWVNGKPLETHRGGYAPFAYDITDLLKPTGEQEIVVAVTDPADPKQGAYQPKGKQLGSEGIWYTRTTGIWQTVWLEPVDNVHIESFRLEPKIEAQGAFCEVHAEITGGANTILSVEIYDRNRKVGSAENASSSGSVTFRVAIDTPHFWTPEKPELYEVKLQLSSGGHTVDEMDSYFALRTVGLENGRITLNGKPYFLKGVLDQGYWPDGIYTPPSDEAIKNDVLMTKAFGFNLARKHVKVEDPRWYYWCDKLGLLVAQDMPSSHNLTTQEAKDNFVHEWKEVMEAVRFHPSIVLWIPFNENWGDPKEFQDEVVELTRAADPTRPIIDASGWTQREKTDITDIHDYGNDLRKHAVANPKRPTWIGEYGGVALPIEGHTWVTGWGYQSVKTPEELVDKYRFLTDQINEAEGLSGFVYTQLTDVEQELNGLMTYDRIPKAPPEKIAIVNAGKSKGTNLHAAAPSKTGSGE